MIPVFECLEQACVVGIAWNPDMLAAFLAWWMPLNLLSFIAMLVLLPVLIPSAGWRPEVLTLKQFALMTLVFWPKMVGIVTYAMTMDALEKRRRKKLKNTQRVYFTDEDF